MRLYARDQGKRVGSFGIAMIASMEGYVDADGLLDANLLPEPLRTSYRELKEGKKPTRQWMLELKASLGVADEDSESDDGLEGETLSINQAQTQFHAPCLHTTNAQ